MFLNAACADPVPPRLMRNLKGHHVMRAGLNEGVLKLTTTHSMVSFGIYENIIKEGACSVLMANPEKGWENAKIDRIKVLNRDERQGYAFVDARETCLELDKITDEEKRNTFFSEQTRVCTMEACDDPMPNRQEEKGA